MLVLRDGMELSVLSLATNQFSLTSSLLLLSSKALLKCESSCCVHFLQLFVKFNGESNNFYL